MHNIAHSELCTITITAVAVAGDDDDGGWWWSEASGDEISVVCV